MNWLYCQSGFTIKICSVPVLEIFALSPSTLHLPKQKAKAPADLSLLLWIVPESIVQQICHYTRQGIKTKFKYSILHPSNMDLKASKRDLSTSAGLRCSRFPSKYFFLEEIVVYTREWECFRAIQPLVKSLKISVGEHYRKNKHRLPGDFTHIWQSFQTLSPDFTMLFPRPSQLLASHPIC